MVAVTWNVYCVVVDAGGVPESDPEFEELVSVSHDGISLEANVVVLVEVV